MKNLLAIMFTALIAIASIAGIKVTCSDSTFVFDWGDFPVMRVVTRFEGPQPSADRNDRDYTEYEAIPLISVLEYVGGMREGDLLKVEADDGYSKAFPFDAIYGRTALGNPYIGYREEKPYFIFVPDDGEVSNEDMLASLGEEYSNFYDGLPSSKGLVVKGVSRIRIETSRTVSPSITEIETVPVPSPDWRIEIKGTGKKEISSIDFGAVEADDGYYVEISLERKGETNTYRAIPLWLVVAAAREDEQKQFSQYRELWEGGFDITLTSVDGYSVTFSTLDVPIETIFIADEENGEKITPAIVGEISGKLWVKGLASIELDIERYFYEDPRLSVSLVIKTGGLEREFTIADLETKSYYVESYGQYITSSGGKHGGLYGGVELLKLVGELVELNPTSTIRTVASDGYETTYSAREIESADGIWIVAFKLDGDYLPEDPGYFRTIKVGPDMPAIESRRSAKMVKIIEVIDFE
jgi:hypothetical protein